MTTYTTWRWRSLYTSDVCKMGKRLVLSAHCLVLNSDSVLLLYLAVHYIYGHTTRLRPTSLIMVSAKSLTDRSRSLSFQPMQMWSHFIRPLCVRPAANHESHGQRVSIHEVRRRTAIPTWSWWWCNQLAGVYRGYSTCQMNWKWSHTRRHTGCTHCPVCTTVQWLNLP